MEIPIIVDTVSCRDFILIYAAILAIVCHQLK